MAVDSHIQLHRFPAGAIRVERAQTSDQDFHDTGLLNYLLGIDSVEPLIHHPQCDEVFENLTPVGDGLGIPTERRSVVYRGDVDFRGKHASFISARTYLTNEN